MHAFSVLRRALRDAERKGLVAHNVCRLVDPPKRAPYEVNAPEMDAMVDILTAAEDTQYGPILNFMARTGVRRGEAVALKWRNVDLKSGVATVVESAVRVPGQSIMFRPTKSAAGRRGIALDPRTVALLRQHRARQNEHILALGGAYEDQGLVFNGIRGGPLDLDDVSHQFKRIAIRAGHPDVTLHGLRHGHAAGLIKTGAHPRVVQERLGHASAAFTQQVYGHVAKGLQEQAANAFADALDETSS
ncbi:MAG: site-specific integrase [Chloroflexi bacterium]|nr:site-specific integrase [Chloroflexota bacterium]